MSLLQAPLKRRLPKLTWRVEDIPTPSLQRKKLWGVVKEYTGNPLLLDFASGLIRKYNVPERDDLALAIAAQHYAQHYIKFFREDPERFTSPLRTIVWGFGDCDDKSIFIATILRSFRIPVRLKFIRFTVPSGKKVSHVYPQAKINGQWISLESVHKWDIGVDPEDLARAKGIIPQVYYYGDK